MPGSPDKGSYSFTSFTAGAPLPKNGAIAFFLSPQPMTGRNSEFTPDRRTEIAPSEKGIFDMSVKLPAPRPLPKGQAPKGLPLPPKGAKPGPAPKGAGVPPKPLPHK